MSLLWAASIPLGMLAVYGVIRWSQSFPDDEAQHEQPQTASVAPELERRAA